MNDSADHAARPLVALVDDEKEITQILAEELSVDYEIVQFNHPRQFIEAVKTSQVRPAVLVIDLKMPGMNGLEALRELNDFGVTIPTIMFSGYLDKDDAITALDLGVIHIIEKPIDLGFVHEVVNDSLIDWELMRTREEIREMTKQIKEIYATIRMAVSQHIPNEIAEKIFFSSYGDSDLTIEELLAVFEDKLEFLLSEENLLAKMKQTQFRKALERRARRAS